MVTVKIRFIFWLSIFGLGRYHGNISFNDRRIYPSFWSKLRNSEIFSYFATSWT